MRLRNVSRKSARFRISSTRTSDITSTATAVSSGSGGVRAVYKPRGPVPAGLTCDVAVELTPGQFEVFLKVLQQPIHDCGVHTAAALAEELQACMQQCRVTGSAHAIAEVKLHNIKRK